MKKKTWGPPPLCMSPHPNLFGLLGAPVYYCDLACRHSIHFDNTMYLIVGEVLFDRNHPEQPPDFIFSPKDEATNFSPRLEQLPVSTVWTDQLDCRGRSRGSPGGPDPPLPPPPPPHLLSIQIPPRKWLPPPFFFLFLDLKW